MDDLGEESREVAEIPPSDGRDKGQQDGAANRSQPLSSEYKSDVTGGWLPSLTFALGLTP